AVAAGFTGVEPSLGDMFAIAAMDHQFRRRLIHRLGDADIVHAHLARAAATSAAEGARLRKSPGKRLDMNLLLVLVILRFTFNAVYLQKHVSCHKFPPYQIKATHKGRRIPRDTPFRAPARKRFVYEP